MDILDIHYIAKKYSEKLIDCFIDNIYFAGYYWLFKLRCKTGKELLKIEPGVRVHLSRVEPSSKGIDKFTAFLRKHIRGGKIVEVKQLGWERILLLRIGSHNNEYVLVVEVIPRGFLVLLDSSNRIMYANKFAELRDRVIKKGYEYSPPPGNTDYNKYFEKLSERILVGKDLVRGIVRGWGLPGYIAEEILYRAGLFNERRKPVREVDRKTINNIIEVYRELIRESLNGKGYLVRDHNTLLLYTSFKPSIYLEVYDAIIEEYSDLEELIDYYFTEYEKSRVLEENKKRIESEINSLKNTIEKQEELLRKYREKYKYYTQIANILSSNYPLVESIIECAKSVRSRYDWDHIPRLCSNVIRVDKHRGLVYASINGYEIPLSIRVSTWDNICEYYKLASSFKEKARKAEEYLVKLREKLNTLEKTIHEYREKVAKGIRPRYWFERYHWLITRNGFLVIGGRDASQNEAIVKKYLSKNDIFLHADIHGAPATILLSQGREPSIEDILDAATLAACYSRAWKEGLGYIDVFWVRGSQVSKTPPSGEYLARGAFMIYGKKNYVRVELKLGIGVEEVCDPVYGIYQRVIIGPPDLIKKKSIVYAIIVPGEEKVVEGSRKLLDSFNELVSNRVGVSQDELSFRLPGRFRVLAVERGEAEPIETCG